MSTTPTPRRGIIARTKEFYAKWRSNHKAAGNPNPEKDYKIIKLFKRSNPKK